MPDTIYVSASGPCFKGDKEEHKRKYGIFFGKLLQYLSQLQTEAYSGSQLLNEPFSRFETRLKRVDCTSDAIKVHKGFFDSSTTSIKAAPSQLMDANGSMVLERTLASSSYGQHLLSSSPQPLFVNVKRVIETVNTHNDPILIIAYKDDTVRVVKGKRSLDGADISKEHINLEDLKTIGDEDDVNKIIVSTTMTKEKRTAYFENVKPFGKDTVFKVTSSFPKASTPSHFSSTFQTGSMHSNVWREGTKCFSNDPTKSGKRKTEDKIISSMGVCPRSYPFFPPSNAPFFACLEHDCVFDVRVVSSMAPLTVMCVRGEDSNNFSLVEVDPSFFPPSQAKLSLARALAWSPAFKLSTGGKEVDVQDVVSHRGPFLRGLGEDFVQKKRCDTKAWKKRITIRDQYTGKTKRVFSETDNGATFTVKEEVKQVNKVKPEGSSGLYAVCFQTSTEDKWGIFDEVCPQLDTHSSYTVVQVKAGSVVFEVDGETRLVCQNPFFKPDDRDLLVFTAKELIHGVRTRDLFSRCTRIIDRGAIEMGVVDAAFIGIVSEEGVYQKKKKCVCISEDQVDIPFYLRLHGQNGGSDLFCNLKLHQDPAICSYVRSHDAPFSVTSHCLQELTLTPQEMCTVGGRPISFGDNVIPVHRYPKLSHDSASKATITSRERNDPYPALFGNVHEIDALVTFREFVQQSDELEIDVVANSKVSFLNSSLREGDEGDGPTTTVKTPPLCTPDGIIVSLPLQVVKAQPDDERHSFFFETVLKPEDLFTDLPTDSDIDYEIKEIFDRGEKTRYEIRRVSAATWPPVFKIRRTRVRLVSDESTYSFKLYSPMCEFKGILEAKSHIRGSMKTVYDKYERQVRSQKRIFQTGSAAVITAYLISWSFKGFTLFQHTETSGRGKFDFESLGKSTVFSEPSHDSKTIHATSAIIEAYSQFEARIEESVTNTPNTPNTYLVRHFPLSIKLFQTPTIQSVSQHGDDCHLIEYLEFNGKFSHLVRKDAFGQEYHLCKEFCVEKNKLNLSNVTPSTKVFGHAVRHIDELAGADSGNLDMGVSLFTSSEGTAATRFCVLGASDERMKAHLNLLQGLKNMTCECDPEVWIRWWIDLTMIIALSPSRERMTIKLDPDLRRKKGFEDAAVSAVLGFEEMVMDAKSKRRDNEDECEEDDEAGCEWLKTDVLMEECIGDDGCVIKSMLQRSVSSMDRLPDTIRIQFSSPEAYKICLPSGDSAYYVSGKKHSVRREDRDFLSKIFEDKERPLFHDARLEGIIMKKIRALSL